MAFRSIRWRLQAWYGLILVMVLFALGLAAYNLQRARIFHQIDDELKRRVGELATSFRQPPLGPGARPRPGPPDFEEDPPRFEQQLPRQLRDGPNRPPDMRDREDDPRFQGGRPQPRGDFRLGPRQARLFDSSDPYGFYYVIWGPDRAELSRATNAPTDLVSSPQPVTTGPTPPTTRAGHRDSSVTLLSGETILAGRVITPELAELRHTAWTLAGVGVLVLAFGLTGGWWVSSVAIRPIRNISDTATKIAAGDLGQRISVHETESELGRLASLLNSTFARLEAAFLQQKQFTSDAAHELRTPVAVVLTQAQSALNRERSAPEYRETIEACQRAAQRMKRLIESLLELARFDAGQEPIKKIPYDLAATVRESADLVAPLAAERKVNIALDVPAMPCSGDPERIGQVVTNLLTNGIQYNREGGQVRITGQVSNGTVDLIIEDSGIGISQDQLPDLFKRFFRGDKSRTGGHSGLGLAISKAIVEAHGGSIEAQSREGEGSTFTLKLPAQ